MTDLRDWLEKIGLGKYAPRFAEHEISVHLLPELTNDDLKEIGIPLGPRKVLLKAIAGLAEDRTGGDPSGLVDSGPTDAERRQLTVMFCDLVGSTELSQTLDPEELREVNLAYQDTCKAAIERFDGYVARYMGDGVLAYFGYPQAHEDDAERATRSGLDLVHAMDELNGGIGKQNNVEFSIRVGIATGPVVVGDLIGEGASQESAVVGETPNLAARLQGVAVPNTVVASEMTHKLTGNQFECESLGALELKGIAEPVQAWRIVAPRAVDSLFEARHGAGLTPLIGREHEVGLLLERWEQAKDGDGQVVLLSGEAGIGKSRISEILRERVAPDKPVSLRYQCSPYHGNSALYPVIEQLERAAHFVNDDSSNAKLRKLESLLTGSTSYVAGVLPLFAELVSLAAEGQFEPLEMTPARRREKTLEALVEQVRGLSRERAVLLIFEDAHWADPTSLELVELIIQQVQGERVLALITARPEFTPQWMGHTHITSLTLNRFSHSLVTDMIGKVTGGKPLPDEVRDQIIERTDGVPLFVEELTKTVLGSGLVEEQDGAYVLTGPLPPLAIPTTLQDSLMARLDRLAPIKEVAQFAAAIGRQFSHELLAAVSPLDAAALERALDQLVEAELVYRQGRSGRSYIFKHALLQEAAYESLLRSKRQMVHARIAESLVEKFPEIVAAQPELLAYHYTEASLDAEAIEFWLQAGRRAVERSANPEAVAHLTRGLSLVETLADTPQRARQELALQIALGAPLMATKGFASTEIVNVHARARELCESLGEIEQYDPVLYGQWVNHTVVGHHRTARSVAAELLTLGEKRKDTAIIMRAHVSLGWSAWLLGELATGLLHNDKALSLYDPERDSELRFRYAHDPYMPLLVCRTYQKWLCGFPQQAATAAVEGIAHARELDHAGSLTYALWGAAQFAASVNRDASAAEGLTVELIQLSEQQALPLWLGYGRMIFGWSLAERGRREEGLALLRDGIANYKAQGRRLFLPLYLALQAELDIDGGELHQAQQTLDEAMAYIERSDERTWEAQIHRLRGEASIGGTADNATECFQRALEVARQQGAKSLELRAATSFARLRQEQGESAEARDVLAPVYDWFTEGFDTADLQAAKALLESL